jgi:uncharacterized membrane protein (DUF485 family)
MLSLIIWFLCVYIIFKGVEIFQIALMSGRADRKLGLTIGAVMIGISIVAAAGFLILNENQAEQMKAPLQNWQR